MEILSTTASTTQRMSLLSFVAVLSLAIIAVFSLVSRTMYGIQPPLNLSLTSSSSNSFKLTSTGIDNDNVLDTAYTCLAPTDSTNDDFEAKAAAGVSPPLSWSGAPSKTKSFMITMTSSGSDKDCTR